MNTLLTPGEMAVADRISIEQGPLRGIDLMNNAGAAVAAEVLARLGECKRALVLCGPGNNGGDGYVIARLLCAAGMNVRVFALGQPRKGADAAIACDAYDGDVLAFDEFQPDKDDIVVDAIFGAGLDRAVTGVVAEAIGRAKDAVCAVVAVDLPSGVSGETGHILGAAFAADLTVTFFRKKPGHVLYPGRELCGDVVVADIGIRTDVLGAIRPACHENTPELWSRELPKPAAETHKYAHGAVAVFSGGPSSTGAARLAAQASARSGAGAVTVLSPPAAIIVNACHLTSIMVRAVDTTGDVEEYFKNGRTASAVIGPGFGMGKRLRSFCRTLLEIKADEAGGGLRAVVLDADAISEFADKPDTLFDAIRTAAFPVILTPHEGEFGRLFPDLAAAEDQSGKLQRARAAAERAGAIIVLKGPDTVIAEPGGKSAVNTNATPALATAGSGDVLAGIIAGLAAQAMPAFEAACAGVWIHGGAGNIAAPGAMAEDLANAAGPVLAGLRETCR